MKTSQLPLRLVCATLGITLVVIEPVFFVLPATYLSAYTLTAIVVASLAIVASLLTLTTSSGHGTGFWMVLLGSAIVDAVLITIFFAVTKEPAHVAGPNQGVGLMVFLGQCVAGIGGIAMLLSVRAERKATPSSSEVI